MKISKGVLHITKEEYDELPDKRKGHIDSEYMDEGVRHSFMWNRTAIINRKMYVEGLSMAITR